MGFSSIDAIFIIGMIAVMWFLIIQPKRKEQQAISRMLAALKKGDKVMTHSGMIGEVAQIKEPIITLRFHDNVRIDFDRSAIAKAIKDEAEKAGDVKSASKADEKVAEGAKA